MIRICGIYVCEEKGKPMVEVNYARCIKGVGIAGDRYATGKGTYSQAHNLGKPGVYMRQVTFMTLEQLSKGNEILEKLGKKPYKPIDTRRNFFIAERMTPNEFVGKEFEFGGVRFRGFEEAPPCKVPTELFGEEGFVEAFKLYGGYRAEVLTDGVIKLYDLGHFVP